MNNNHMHGLLTRDRIIIRNSESQQLIEDP